MSTSHAYSAFPEFRDIILNIPMLPLKARSLLIKQCQAQYDVPEKIPSPIPTIIRLLESHPLVPVRAVNADSFSFIGLTSYFRYHNISVQHAIQSAFILDLLRGLPVDKIDATSFKDQGWVKELKLCLDYRNPTVNFRPFFFSVQDPIHPDLPDNPINLFRIRNAFRAFRQRIIDSPPTWYSRWTHKNMSYSTRRSFEEAVPGSSLAGIPIFGQDDWLRFYHETGIALEGDIEFRQTWTASQAKPRVYACNGGTSYNKSRHLQDFFTELTSIFPPTHRITRLSPGRLYLPPLDPNSHYRVYDLSAFTSNCVEQKSFCDTLAEFFDGVLVYIVDEVEGLMQKDLGEMLREYNDVCIERPLISLERVPNHIRPDPVVLGHGIASLLGVFGNLMTCTVAHYLIMSPLTDSFDEDNTAGDDGLVIETDYSSFYVDKAILIVGDYEPTKTFDSREEGAICLKRPLSHIGNRLSLGRAVIPPTLVTAMTYLSGKEVDSRYTFYNLEDMPLRDRVAVVGVDLMRFMRATYRKGDLEDLPVMKGIWHGYKKLASSYLHSSVEAYCAREGILWPLDPETYDFYGVDPYEIWVYWNVGEKEIDRYGYSPILSHSLRLQGDEIVGNSNPRLKMLETLGYVEIVRVTEHLDIEQSWNYLMADPKSLRREPVLRRIKCLRDVPEYLLFD